MPNSGTPSHVHRSPNGGVSGASGAILRIDEACRLAVAGKLATRTLAQWVKSLDIVETEFRLLWLMWIEPAAAAVELPHFDQTCVAQRLAVSPAQVSELVERLQLRGLIERQPCPSDRRRQRWRLTNAGRDLIDGVIAALARRQAEQEAA